MAASLRHLQLSLLSLLLFHCFASGVYSASFTITNNCNYLIWPGILSGAGTPPLSTTGFELKSGASAAISVPSSWSGRLWARTHCSTDSSSGKFACATGDCGSGAVDCSGAGAKPPASLAEFTLNGAGGRDFYDVSLVDGYNLPVLVVPQQGNSSGGGENCTSTGCIAELNGGCPAELRVSAAEGSAVGCKSACEAFGDARYCCSGAYATPDTCKPTEYSEYFKSSCPSAYSYAYDDGTSTFTCDAGVNYAVTFCPSPSSPSGKPNGGGGGAGDAPPSTQNLLPHAGGAVIGGYFSARAFIAAAVLVSSHHVL